MARKLKSIGLEKAEFEVACRKLRNGNRLVLKFEIPYDEKIYKDCVGLNFRFVDIQAVESGDQGVPDLGFDESSESEEPEA